MGGGPVDESMGLLKARIAVDGLLDEQPLELVRKPVRVADDIVHVVAGGDVGKRADQGVERAGLVWNGRAVGVEQDRVAGEGKSRKTRRKAVNSVAGPSQDTAGSKPDNDPGVPKSPDHLSRPRGPKGGLLLRKPNNNLEAGRIVFKGDGGSMQTRDGRDETEA